MNTLTYAHSDRSHWLGATDIVKLAGLGRWGSEIQVWEEKVAGLNGKPRIEQEEPGPVLLQLGKFVEPFIADRYQALSAHTLHAVRSAPLVHPDVAYWACSPDFLIRDYASLIEGRSLFLHGLETKLVLFGGNRSEELETWGEEGTDQVPQDYLVQCQWSLAVTGLPRWDLAALWYGAEIRRYTILPQPELIARLKEVADDFWTNHVLTEKPPKPDGSKDYSRFLAKDTSRRAYSLRFDLDNDPAYQDKELLAHDGRLLKDYALAVRVLRGAAANKEQKQQEIALRFGTAAKIRYDGLEYAIRSQTRSTTDWKGIVQEISHELDPALFDRHTKTGEPFLVTSIKPSPNKE